MSDMQWMPQINRQRCTACKCCIQVCPARALIQHEGKAMLAYPESCIYCAVCEDICPAGAIQLPILILKARS